MVKYKMTKKKKEKKDPAGYTPYILLGFVIIGFIGCMGWVLLEVDYSFRIMGKEYAHNGIIWGECHRMTFGRLRCKAINPDDLCEHEALITPTIILESVENPKVLVETEVVCSTLPSQYAIEVQ